MSPHRIEQDDVLDVLIIGAGLSGIYSLYKLRKEFPHWRVKAVEAGSDAGGVWYWNQYPGYRIDTESLSYCYSFDRELLDECDWEEQSASQPQTHAYIRRVVKKHDLRKDIRFDTRIKSATWDAEWNQWTFTSSTGEVIRTRYFVSCLGFLSAPTVPDIPGVKSFAGTAFHTSRWPSDLDIGQDFAGKRIGVIGTGATGIQTITALSEVPAIKSSTAFQRTANWSAPLRNSPISKDQMAEYKAAYGEMFQQCAKTSSGFLHAADPRKTLDLTSEERIYGQPGFAKWLGVFSDTYSNREANSLYSDFIASKIRKRVHDPAVAESLIPKDHGFGTRRVPLESGYFEAYNKPNVHPVDLKKTPIETAARDGIRTTDGVEHDLYVLIFATGVDAITGAFNAIEWQAKDGYSLMPRENTFSKNGRDDDDIWSGQRPRSFLGMTVPSMPNTFMVLGPHRPFGNATRSIEHAMQFISDLLHHCEDNDYACVEPTEEAVDAWTKHVIKCSEGSALVNEVDSWMTGVNTNVKGKMMRNVVRYSGSAIEYRKRCTECKDAGYAGLAFA